jgi:hypothetical protein
MAKGFTPALSQVIQMQNAGTKWTDFWIIWKILENFR